MGRRATEAEARQWREKERDYADKDVANAIVEQGCEAVRSGLIKGAPSAVIALR